MIGKAIGPYRIVAKLGEGGMGEVYRAHDARLNRDVALKVLPELVATDADRLARFRREAQVLAAFNHPNIAQIHGIEGVGSGSPPGKTRPLALVMELVEGPTLADLIGHGHPEAASVGERLRDSDSVARRGGGAAATPEAERVRAKSRAHGDSGTSRGGGAPRGLKIDDALAIARQIAEALEAAHEQGIIHRDLKPANVKVRDDGTVKVLDFGLAKALEPPATSDDLAAASTISSPAMTRAGTILGTAAYMSPEQARGKPADRRADIWAFGCVLFEMLTGQRPFKGDDVSDVLANVLTQEPNWAALPPRTPPRIRHLLERCLKKDVRQRLQAIAEARIALDGVLSGAPESAPLLTAPRPPWRRALPWALGFLAVAVTGVAVWLLKPSPARPPQSVLRLEIPLPEGVAARGFALSPDGSKLAFIATGADHQSRVWVRSLDTLVTRPLDGTEGANFWPFWSPDSRFIGFFAQGKLKKIEASGGAALALCDTNQVFGGAWNRAGTIVFASDAGILQVAASGGSPLPIDTAGGASAPSFLPDGRHFVYFRWGGSDIGIFLDSVDAKPKGQPVKVSADVSNPVYVPSSDPAGGYLLFVHGSTAAEESIGTLMAQRFDTRHLKLIGEAVPIADHVSNVNYSASATDVLVYRTTPDIRAQLTWLDRAGKVLGTFGEPGVYSGLALSPDGKRVAFLRPDPQNAAATNIWLYDFGQDRTTRLTFDAGSDNNPTWSPHGNRLAYGSFRRGVGLLYEKSSNLAGEEQLLLDQGQWPTSWSPDGRFLLCYDVSPHAELTLVPLGIKGASRKPIPVGPSKFNQAAGRFSPDGRWIAYQSNESGRSEVYVRPFDASSTTASSSTGSEVPVSKDGGTAPLWSRHANEIFYVRSDGYAMAVEVSTSGGVFRAASPKALFKVPADVDSWDVSADGRRFLMALPSGARSSGQPFSVVLDWQAELNN